MPRRLWIAIASLILIWPAIAQPQSIPSAADLPTGPRPDSYHIWNGLAFGINPVVLGDQFKVYRKMPWGEGKTLLTSDSHWRLGSINTISPSYLTPGILIGVSPLLIMDLDVHYGPAFNTMYYTYQSYRSRYDPSSLGEPRREIGVFHQATANLTLKAAVGPIAVLELVDQDYYYSEKYFFDWEVGTIIKEGWSTRSKTFLACEYATDRRLFINYEYFLYYPSAFQNQLASLGLLFTNLQPWNFTWIFQTGYHLEHPKFKGIKVWTAAFAEWDFPIKPK